MERTFHNGAYVINFGEGKLEVTLHGEPWKLNVGAENLVMAMWVEIRALEKELGKAQARVSDLLQGDDGHAYKEGQRYLDATAHNHLSNVLRSNNGASYDAAREYLRRVEPAMEAAMDAVNPPADDDEDYHDIAYQMISFCQGYAAPDDIDDIRAALMLTGMSLVDADHVLWAMRNVRKHA